MSELSRSLVDAAAEAMYLAWHRSVPFEDQAEDVRADYFLASSPVVAAVLETLAADLEARIAVAGGPELRRLAAEAREGE